MASPTEQAIRDILREAGRPMTTAEIGEQLARRLTLKTAKPANTVRNVLATYNRTCVSAGRGLYVYLPAAANGAAVRGAIRLVARKGWQCAVGAELATLLWPGVGDDGPARASRVALEDGPTVEVAWPKTTAYHSGYAMGPWVVLKLPEPFWGWWQERQRAGADQLLVRCEDAEAGRYAATAVGSGELDAAAVEAANQATREAAADALKGTDRGLSFWTFVGRLLARRAFHQEVSPDPLAGILLLPYPRFLLTGFERIEYRPDLTPGLADLLRDRLLQGWAIAEEQVRESLRLPAEIGDGAAAVDPFADLGERAPARPFPPPETAPAEVVQAVRLKVALQWMPEVWRSIEIREDQTLDELHRAIQRAFGWDDDHLYAFFLTGRAWDQLTEVERPRMFDDFAPPSFFEEFEPIFADEVAVADVEPAPKKRFLYIFDFGDDLRHDLTVQALAPADGGNYPRIVETHGEAPPQYPSWDEEEAWDDEDEEGDEGDGDWAIDVAADGAAAPYPIGEPFPLAAGAPWPGQEAGPPRPPEALVETMFDVLGIERPRFNDLARFDLPAPDPALRPLPIDLNELVPAFAVAPELRFVLDLERGDVLLVPQVDTPESRPLKERIEGDPARYVAVPEGPFEATPEEMAAFAETVDDPLLRERLLAAARGKAPLVRFQRELSRNEAVAGRWDAALQRRLLERTLAWLADHGIYPTPPAARPSQPAEPGKKAAAGKHKTPTSKRAAKRRKG